MDIRTRASGAILSLCLAAWGAGAAAQAIEPREGWFSAETDRSYDDLVRAVKDAAAGSPLAVVTEAGPTEAAARRGVEIPGNRVIGLFNNAFAVRILELSPAAMIEAPVRMYITETEDGAALSYKLPSFVFAPYEAEGGAALRDAADELDAIFAEIAEAARR